MSPGFLWENDTSACMVTVKNIHMGGCQNYGSILDPLNTRCGILIRTQKRSIILTRILT